MLIKTHCSPAIITFLKQEEIVNLNILGVLDNVPDCVIYTDSETDPTGVLVKKDDYFYHLYTRNPVFIDSLFEEILEEGFYGFSGLAPDLAATLMARATRVDWTSPCDLYYLPDGKLSTALKTRETSPLSPTYAELVDLHYPYRSNVSKRDIEECLTNRPSSAYYVNNDPVCWVMIHNDDSIGIMHTLEAHRRHGYAVDVTIDLCQQIIDSGKIPYLQIVQSNDMSPGLALKCGFEKFGEATWFGITIGNPIERSYDMFRFPENLYVDIRMEETFDTKISFKKLSLQEQKIRNNKGAFIRVFDGNRWYYSSTSDWNAVQDQIDLLAEMATPNPDINNHPIVKAFEVHEERILQYTENSVTDISPADKQALIEKYLKLLTDDTIVNHTSYYVDNKTVKSIYSSKGTSVTFDKQTCGIRIGLELASGENKDAISISRAEIHFDALTHIEAYIQEELEKSIHFIKHAEPVVPGEYTVLMSPLATGIFTHESFGHKSESDFMVGDETMKAEWALGKKVANPIVTIIDDGMIEGNGYVPFDDEGTRGKKTMIITEGQLTGRLHSTMTAALMSESLTGNARATNFEFEPIVRMTTTYIEKGHRPLTDIISEIENGIFIDNIKHGSGMSTFTLAPSRAYKIENGKITTPVKISVVTGNVFKTLDDVDAISSEFELVSFVGGGCGKMEQWPLPVGFGGPFTRVSKLNVQ